MRTTLTGRLCYNGVVTRNFSKILLAGDFHGNANHAERVFWRARAEGAEAVVQLGDYGFGWETRQYKGTGGVVECAFTRTMEKFVARTDIPFYWIDGNHENFDLLESTLGGLYPEDDGTYMLRPGVFYIPRGTMLNWSGVRILCCGGAVSVDRRHRTPYVSWWPQEAITDENVERCALQGEADILLTHDFPWECNIVDRHLAPYWGEEANTNSSLDRMRVSTILNECRAYAVFHGHLHIPYYEEIRYPNGSAVVKGLDCDATPLDGSTHLLDLGALASA